MLSFDRQKFAFRIEMPLRCCRFQPFGTSIGFYVSTAPLQHHFSQPVHAGNVPCFRTALKRGPSLLLFILVQPQLPYATMCLCTPLFGCAHIIGMRYNWVWGAQVSCLIESTKSQKCILGV